MIPRADDHQLKSKPLAEILLPNVNGYASISNLHKRNIKSCSSYLVHRYEANNILFLKWEC
jgi:hypothetical protein